MSVEYTITRGATHEQRQYTGQMRWVLDNRYRAVEADRWKLQQGVRIIYYRALGSAVEE